jgi:hypothetical protein
MDTFEVAVKLSSDVAAAKLLAVAESYLAPGLAAQLQERLKAFRLRSAAAELDVDAPGLGALRVLASVTVTEAG